MDDRFISQFWENYTAKLKTYGIKPHRVRWDVTRATQSIQIFPDRPPATHTVQGVEHYLQDKRRKAGLKGAPIQRKTKPSQLSAQHPGITPVCRPASPHHAPSA